MPIPPSDLSAKAPEGCTNPTLGDLFAQHKSNDLAAFEFEMQQEIRSHVGLCPACWDRTRDNVLDRLDEFEDEE